MSNSVSVDNFPSEKSHYRVAFDLMKEISRHEPIPINAREHFLTLYKQCFLVVYREKTFEEATTVKNTAGSMGIRF